MRFCAQTPHLPSSRASEARTGHGFFGFADEKQPAGRFCKARFVVPAKAGIQGPRRGGASRRRERRACWIERIPADFLGSERWCPGPPRLPQSVEYVCAQSETVAPFRPKRVRKRQRKSLHVAVEQDLISVAVGRLLDDFPDSLMKREVLLSGQRASGLAPVEWTTTALRGDFIIVR